MSGLTMVQRWVCLQRSRHAMRPYPVFLYHWLFKLIGLLLKMKYPDIYKQEKLSLVENSNLQFISCSTLWAFVSLGYQFWTSSHILWITFLNAKQFFKCSCDISSQAWPCRRIRFPGLEKFKDIKLSDYKTNSQKHMPGRMQNCLKTLRVPRPFDGSGLHNSQLDSQVTTV